MTDDFLKKVILVAEAKYDIDADMLEEFKYEIEQCYNMNYTVRRTVDTVANIIFAIT